jgi:methionyl-tRNA formyltransferase
MATIERIVFFGTPRFALPALDALVAAGRVPLLVVSRPARPAGRGRRLVDPPVAVRAREIGLPVEQPERVRAPEFSSRLEALAPDLAVVVAFGQIFPRTLLELPRHGCLNLHASLLPRWRGAAPIAAAIAAGDPSTGVCLMRMEEGLDTGPVLARCETAIGERETSGGLAERLARLGADLLLEALPKIERGGLSATPQPIEGVTYAPKLGGVRDLSLHDPAAELSRAFRAATPEPGAALTIRGERIKLLDLASASLPAPSAPGVVIAVGGQALRISCGDGGALDLLRVQRPGGRPIAGRDLANGLRLTPGDRLT